MNFSTILKVTSIGMLISIGVLFGIACIVSLINHIKDKRYRNWYDSPVQKLLRYQIEADKEAKDYIQKARLRELELLKINL